MPFTRQPDYQPAIKHLTFSLSAPETRNLWDLTPCTTHTGLSWAPALEEGILLRLNLHILTHFEPADMPSALPASPRVGAESPV